MLVLSATGTCRTSQLGRKQLPSSRNCSLQDMYYVLTYQKIICPATTRERPPPGRVHIITSTQSRCWEEDWYFCHYVKYHSLQMLETSNALHKLLIAYGTVSHMLLPRRYGTVSHKLLPRRYGTASQCNRCLMQHLHSPLGAV